MDEEYENKHVHKFYSKHALDFNITRTKPWPKIINFLNCNDKTNFVNLDAGCGNGRNLPNNGGHWLGFDYAKELLECIEKIKGNLVRGDCLSLPFKNKSFDLILSIAVLHHFSTEERRINAIKEIYRVLKDTGKVLLYVWNEDTKFKNKFKQINNKDYLVKFAGVFDRYYYLYDHKELVDFCIKNGFTVEEDGIEQESIYVILSKK